MADNFVANPGAGGATFAADEIAGVKYPRSKVAFGVDGVATDVSNLAPLPVIINDVMQSGTLAAVDAAVTLQINGHSSAAIQITGMWVGTTTFEGTVDGVNWSPINGVGATTSTPTPIIGANGLYRLTPGGLEALRIRMVTYTAGTANVSMNASMGVGGTFANQILPVKMTNGVDTATIKAASAAAVVADSALVVAISPNSPLAGLYPTDRFVNSTATVGLPVTATLPAPGAGLFNYVTYIGIQLYAASASPGTGLPLGVTTTNMPGNPAYYFPTAMAIGTIDRYQAPILTAIKSTAANTATTFTAPGTLSAIWLMNIGYYVAP